MIYKNEFGLGFKFDATILYAIYLADNDINYRGETMLGHYMDFNGRLILRFGGAVRLA